MYATVQDMIDAFGRREMLLIADPEDTGDIDIEHVNKKLASASGTIDFAVAQHNTLPLQNLPVHTVLKLRQICCDLARYLLTGSSGVTVTDVTKDRDTDANAWLDKIALGKMVLVPQPGADAGSGGGLSTQSITAGEASVNDGAERMFGPGAFRDYFR